MSILPKRTEWAGGRWHFLGFPQVLISSSGPSRKAWLHCCSQFSRTCPFSLYIINCSEVALLLAMKNTSQCEKESEGSETQENAGGQGPLVDGWQLKTWELTGLIRVKTENGAWMLRRVLRTPEFKRTCEGAARRREQCHDNQGEGRSSEVCSLCKPLQRGKQRGGLLEVTGFGNWPVSSLGTFAWNSFSGIWEQKVEGRTLSSE